MPNLPDTIELYDLLEEFGMLYDGKAGEMKKTIGNSIINEINLNIEKLLNLNISIKKICRADFSEIEPLLSQIIIDISSSNFSTKIKGLLENKE
ncbi:MAG: hypothetical protein PHF46_00870 [Candidatus Gracilibacteria bacterium]|nr:hypothetical protein [Candidatus Gracilibacteria bacterium]MDD3119944.1 hypothetical protein [Candidatus Gracilibacteria bacterium]MDD4530163.1 hypothetical protein [Candidatus Gracilibacteria bacterium]